MWYPQARLTLSWWLISGKWMSIIGSGWDELIARSLTPSSTKLRWSWPIPRCKRRFWALEWVKLAKQELRRTAIAIMVIWITLDIKHQSRRFQYILYGSKTLVLCIFRWDQLLAIFSIKESRIVYQISKSFNMLYFVFFELCFNISYSPCPYEEPQLGFSRWSIARQIH